MISKIKTFIVNHYLVVSYLVIAILFILGILFKENLGFLIQMLACLVVIGIYAGIGFLGYIVIRAMTADRHFDSKSLKIIIILAVILALLIPVLKFLEMDTEHIGKLYMLAPLASWPAFLAIIILNINTKWKNHKDKRRQQKLQNEN